jgi:large subunit ribosomal protein L19
MTLTIKKNDVEFGIGDRIRVQQKIKEGEKERTQIFAGTVIKIKGEGDNKTFTVRRIGVQQVGIERIFPLNLPSIFKIDVIKKGLQGVRHSKLYYIRKKPRKEIENIYSRTSKKKQ